MTTKYGQPSWDEAPGWANWVAQDRSGAWYWAHNAPAMDSNGELIQLNPSFWTRATESIYPLAPIRVISRTMKSQTSTEIVKEPETIKDLIQERQERYGRFEHQAELAQLLKQTMYAHPKWESLSSYQREALDMIQHKIARIINGDPNYKDSWVDVIGYTERVLEYLNED